MLLCGPSYKILFYALYRVGTSVSLSVGVIPNFLRYFAYRRHTHTHTHTHTHRETATKTYLIGGGYKHRLRAEWAAIKTIELSCQQYATGVVVSQLVLRLMADTSKFERHIYLTKCQTPLHGQQLRTCCTTPPTDELTTILQLVVQQIHYQRTTICHIPTS